MPSHRLRSLFFFEHNVNPVNGFIGQSHKCQIYRKRKRTSNRHLTSSPKKKIKETHKTQSSSSSFQGFHYNNVMDGNSGECFPPADICHNGNEQQQKPVRLTLMSYALDDICL